MMYKNIYKRFDNRGFTLLEIVVALAIIAVLAAAIAPSLIGQLSEKKVVATKSKMDYIEEGIKLFYKDTMRMPPNLNALISNRWDFDRDGDVDAVDAAVIDYLYPNWKGPYLTTTNDYIDTWGKKIQYHYDLDTDITNVETFTLCPPQQNINAVIFSYGRGESRFGAGGNLYNVYGTGHPNNTAVDNDGDGAINEDDYNGIDDDGDGLIDEDPPEVPFVFNDDDRDAITDPATGACNATGVDEDDFDGVDNDADMAVDEDPPNTPKTGVMYRTISVLPIMLEQERIDTTNKEMDDIVDAILAFYKDTVVMPPNLRALVSDKWDTDNDGDIDALDTAYITANYAGWSGPYISGGVPAASNPNLIDGWGKQYIYIFNNESNTLIQDPNILNVDTLEFNPPQINVNALLISVGPNQAPDITGTGTVIPNIDNDGDGGVDEDDWGDTNNDFFLDDDGDGFENEDPPDAAFVLSTNPLQNGDIYRLISVSSVDTEKSTFTKNRIDKLNDAAGQYVLNDGNGDSDAAADEDPIEPGVDNDGDGVTDEDPAGLLDLDVWEGLIPSSTLPGIGPAQAFIFLRNKGWAPGGYQRDAWGNNIRWDNITHGFYSVGPDGLPGVPPGAGDDII